MSGQEGENENFISKNRLEALIDGVFAFAMTLLVISLAISPPIPAPEAAAELPRYLSDMRPAFISFLVAFFVLAGHWGLHHRQFHFVRTVDQGILRINLLILVCVVLIPFTTSVSGEYEFVQIAVVLFHINLLAIGMLFFIHWFYLTRHHHLTEPQIPEHTARCWFVHLLVSPAAALSGIAVSFFAPSLSMLVYLLILPGNYIVKRYVCASPHGTGSEGSQGL
jgi:uncharacterized membrane protein